MKKIFYLQCGLGNQMFEYAYYLYLTSRKNQQLLVDHSANSIHKHGRSNLMSVFPEVNKRCKFIPIFEGILIKWWSDILKKGLHIEPKFLIRGYWQEYFYAESVREELLNDFTFKEFDEEANRDVLSEISSSESVSIHVRRGDYVSAGLAESFGNICNLDYYKCAIEYIGENVKEPRFFVFSDDIQWVKDNIGLDNAVYIDWNTGDHSYKDMQLMSNCQHNVIANSSFSWWGAWLNRNKNKIVVTPSLWFRNYPTDFADKLIPQEWHRIETK